LICPFCLSTDNNLQRRGELDNKEGKANAILFDSFDEKIHLHFCITKKKLSTTKTRGKTGDIPIKEI